MSTPLVKALAKVVFGGAGLLGRSFVQAYKQAVKSMYICLLLCFHM